MLLNWLRKFSRSQSAAAGPRANALFRQGKDANQAGRHADAARLLVAAIEAKPDAAEFHYELGRAMRRLGEPARAVTCFRKAIELDARHLDAHVDLAAAMLALGNPDAAEQAARGALALDARCVGALVNLGAALQGRGEFGASADSYRAALAIEPDCVPALANLSAVCLQTGALDEARRAAEEARRLAPGDADAQLRLGNVLLELREPERAAASYREALRLRPDAAGHAALGFAEDLQGRFDQATQEYARALALDPDHVQTHLNRAALWLLRGELARGWEEFEWRMRGAEQAPLYERFPLPRWDGSPLAGRRILVYAEQGLGDEILFASCIPELIVQAAHCVIDCDPRLARLFARSFAGATVHGGRQSEPAGWLASAGPLDVAVPAGSLPKFLRRTPADFPRRAGYLRAAPERVRAWRERLAALGPGPKIGLSWRGGVPQTGRGSRSLELSELLAALRLPGLTFVSLQYGPTREALVALRERHGVTVHHWQEAIDDYDQTAALACALDLTLSVCTALVDLCGALGRPVWVLAPVRTDFRYGLTGEAMPWYSSARVFRQARYGEWPPVVESAAAALAQRFGQDA
ncbi:MAG TPA: tetratricopeptide repeat protein [Burkholderiales bacterium]|nr:tetratricopeptide repeat protein [Burkholderiales bacterium]